MSGPNLHTNGVLPCPEPPGGGGDLTPFEVAYLSRMVQERSGVNLSEDKAYVVNCRLNMLAMRLGYKSGRAIYRALALEPAGELAAHVVDEMLTKETSFFRNPPLFRALENSLLRELKQETGIIRAWCAACSTGQEAYSLAMSAWGLGLLEVPGVFRVRGTDLSKSALDKARTGLYTQLEIGRGLPMSLMLKHMNQVGHEWQVKPELAAAVAFEEHNLLSALGYGNGQFDLIMCRNVLIYFDRDSRASVVRKLVAALRPGGILVFGASECGAPPAGGLTQHQRDGALYYRKEASSGQGL